MTELTAPVPVDPATLVGLVLLYSTVAHHTRAARLHAQGCPMVNTARGRGKRTTRLIEGTVEYLAMVVDDLNEREFPVKRCRCCRTARGTT
jgi:hypothetical protein